MTPYELDKLVTKANFISRENKELGIVKPIYVIYSHDTIRNSDLERINTSKEENVVLVEFSDFLTCKDLPEELQYSKVYSTECFAKLIFIENINGVPANITDIQKRVVFSKEFLTFIFPIISPGLLEIVDRYNSLEF